MASSSASAHRLVASVVHDWLIGMDVTSSLVLPDIGSQRVGAGSTPAAQLPSRPAAQQQATPLHQRANDEQPQACASMQKPPRKARQKSLQAALAKQQATTAAASVAPAPGFSLADRLNGAAGPAAETANRRPQVEQTQASGPQGLLGQQQTLRILRDSTPPSSHIFGLPSGQPSWAPSMLSPAAQQPAAAPALATASSALGPGFGGQPNDRALPCRQQAHPATSREPDHEPAERQMALSSFSGSQGWRPWIGSSQEGAGGAEPATPQGQQGRQAHPATAGEQGHPAPSGEQLHQPAQHLMALSNAKGRQVWGSWPSNAERAAGAAQPVVVAGHSVAAAPLGAGVLEAPATAGRQGPAARPQDVAATAAGQGLTADPAHCPAAAVPQPGKRKLTMFTGSSWQPPAKLPAHGAQSQDDPDSPRLPGAARLSPQRRDRDVNAVQLAARWPGREQASLQPRPTQAPADAAPTGTGGAWQMSWAGELPVAGHTPACTPQQGGPRDVSTAKYQHSPQSALTHVRGLPAAAAAAAAQERALLQQVTALQRPPIAWPTSTVMAGCSRLSRRSRWQRSLLSHAGRALGKCTQGPLKQGQLASQVPHAGWRRLAMHNQPSLADSLPAGRFGGASFPTPHPDEAASMQAGQSQTPALRTDSKSGRGATSWMPSRQQHLSPRAHLCAAARRQGGQLAAQAQHSPPSAVSRSSLSQQAPAFAKFSCTATLSEREHVCSHHHLLLFARQDLHGLPEWRGS